MQAEETSLATNFSNFGLYRIDINYIKYLHSIDDQVFYDSYPGYKRKPYLGIIVNLNDYEYCIPLTSAKVRQLGWANISEHNYIIYENVDLSVIKPDDVYMQIGSSSVCKKLLSVLEIRKMIPVDASLYTFIDFSQEADIAYKALLEKEYRFLLPFKEDILKKANVLHGKQKTSGVIKTCYCTFSKLEQAYEKYKV